MTTTVPEQTVQVVVDVGSPDGSPYVIMMVAVAIIVFGVVYLVGDIILTRRERHNREKES